MLRWVGLLAASLLAGCGGDREPRPKPKPTPAAPGTLIVRERLPQGPVFVEGSVLILRLIASDGDVVFRKHGKVTRLDRPVLRGNLHAGVYEFRAAQRPCVGNCEVLDPETLKCAAPIAMSPRGRVVATIVLTSDPLACRLEIA